MLYAPGLIELRRHRSWWSQQSGVPRQRARATRRADASPSWPPSACARVSVGGAFAFAALGAVVEAAAELREAGTYGFWERAKVGAKAARAAFA